MEYLFNKIIKTKEFWRQFNEKVAKFKFKIMEPIEKINIEITMTKAIVLTALICLITGYFFVSLGDINEKIDNLALICDEQSEFNRIAVK